MIYALALYHPERGVQRRRLARSGRAGDEQNPSCIVQEILYRSLFLLQHAERLQRQDRRLLTPEYG